MMGTVRTIRGYLICLALSLAPLPQIGLAAQEAAQEVTSLLDKGKRQLNSGQYSQAVESFNRILKLEPQNSEALFYLISSEAALQSQNNPEVNSLLQQGQRLIDARDYKRAAAVFNRILAIDPNNAQALMYLFTLKGVEEANAPESVKRILQAGRNLLDAGQLVPAKTVFERALDVDPDNAEAFYRLGQISQKMGQKDEAVSYYERAVEVAPENYSVLYAIAHNYEEMGFTEKAIEVYRSMVRIGGGDEKWIERARIRLALIDARRLMNQKFPEEGVLVLERAQRAFPDAPEILLALGNLYLVVNRDADAERTLRHLVETAPRRPAGYQALATLYRRKKDTVQERRQLEKILAISPRSSTIYQGALGRYRQLVQARIREQVASGQPEEALRTLDGILALVPDSAEFWLEMANIHERQGAGDAAESALLAALLWKPDNILAQIQLSRIYVRTNRIKDAIPFLQRVATEVPDTKAGQAAVLNLFNIYSQAKSVLNKQEIQSGIEFLKQLVARNPTDAKLHNFMGTIYVRQGEYDEAIASYKRALEIKPDDYEARLRLGIVFEDLTKDEAKAEQTYRALLDAGGTVPETVTQKARRNLIKLYARQDNIDKAMPLIESSAKELMLAPKPESAALVTAYDHEAVILAQLKMLDDAIKMTQEEVQKHHDDVDLALKLGIFLNQAQQFDKAIEQFDRVLKQHPEKISVAIRKAMALERQGRPADAKAVYQQILQNKQATEKQLHMVQLRLGRMSLREKGQEEALRLYSELVKEAPEDQSAWAGLVSVRQMRGEYQLAAEALGHMVALETDPNRARDQAAQILFMLGQEHLVEGDLEGARDIFVQITENFPRNARAFFQLGVIQSQLDVPEQSVALYQKAIEIDPNNFSTRWRLGLLYEQLHREEDAIVVYRTMTHLRTITPQQLHVVEERLKAVKRRIGGLSSSMRYGLNFNRGLNENNLNPRFSYSTTLGFNLNYQNKLNRHTTLGIRFYPTYAVYHVDQFDSLAGGGSGTLTYTAQDWSVTTGYNYQENAGLLSNRGTSRSRSPTLSGKWSLKLKPVFRPWALRPVGSTLRFNLSATSNNSAASPLLGIRGRSAEISFSQPFTAGGWQISYQIQRLENKHALGIDNARQLNQISMSVSRGLRPGISASIQLSDGLLHYTNEDSAFPGHFRRNERVSAALFVSYRLAQNFNLSLGYNRVENNSNLPVGIAQIRTPEQLVTTFQSTGLGDFTNEGLSAVLNFNF